MIDFILLERALVNSSTLEWVLLFVSLSLFFDTIRIRRREATWYWRNNELQKIIIQMTDRSHYSTLKWEECLLLAQKDKKNVNT